MELNRLKPYFHPAWWKLLETHLRGEQLSKPIIAYSKAVKDKEHVSPKAKDLFEVYQLPISKIKVVIIDDEPYTDNNAHGLALSTLQYSLPAKLQTVFKEIYQSQYSKSGLEMEDIFCCGDLRQWTEQGVFLLNRNLSTGIDKHKDFGWHEFTNLTIQMISSYAEESVVFILLCKEKDLSHLIAQRHYTIKIDKLVGSDAFNECNEILSRIHCTGINWGIWVNRVEGFTIAVGPQWTQIVPFYFEKYFVSAIGKNWRIELTSHHDKSKQILDEILQDCKFRKFKFDLNNLTMDLGNFQRLCWLMRIELVKHEANQIWLL